MLKVNPDEHVSGDSETLPGKFYILITNGILFLLVKSNRIRFRNDVAVRSGFETE